MTLAIEQRATPDDLLESRDRGRFELVDGQLVAKPQMLKEGNRVAGIFSFKLQSFLETHAVAVVYPEQEFMCFRRGDDRTRIRKPDVAVVLNEHVAADAADPSFFTVPPDVAIEVISPNDDAQGIARKLADYESVDVPLVLLVYPDRREVEVRPADGPIRVLRASDTLTAEPVLPGFSVKVADLFPPAAVAATIDNPKE